MGAKAFGVQNPTQGETAISWQTWSDGNGGIPIVTGGSMDWGKLGLNAPDEGRSAVYDLGSEATRTFTLTENRYGMGRGSAVLQYRTDTSSFAQDDALPAWTDYTVPFSVNCRYIQIRETMAEFTYFYVDNEATGANNGTSWANAWTSLNGMNWGTLEAATHAHVYISGGSSTKTYYEEFRPQCAGTLGNFITFDIGANSPSPSGHDGTVIIDGGGTRSCGILTYSDANYLRFNGRDGSGNLKWIVQNPIPYTGKAIALNGHAVAGEGCYIYLDYMTAINPSAIAIILNSMQNCRVRGCYVTTGHSLYTDASLIGVYMQHGTNNVIEYSAVYLDISPDWLGTGKYADCIQSYYDTSLTIRNNYVTWATGTGNHNCCCVQSEHGTGNFYFYNNVFLGSDQADGRSVIQFTSQDGGLIYFWNNTIIGTNTTAEGTNDGVIRLQTDEGKLGAIKNNILYSLCSYCLNLSMYSIPVSKIDNNCLYTGGSYVAYMDALNRTWTTYHDTLGYDANGINQDPDYNSADEYRLNATSDCIDVGADLSAYFTTDRDGVIRPVGDGWDIGAYESY